MEAPLLSQEKQELVDGLIQDLDLDDEYYKKIRGTLPNEEFNKMHDDLLNHPLFMTEIPENIEDHPQLQALQNILYDDTPENLATHFNQKGNDLYKKGPDKKYYLKEALKSYTEGIESKSSQNDVNSKLYNNRALIQIKFKNFGKAIEDCKQAIKFKSDFAKPYFRCAQAYNFLFKFKDSVETLQTGIKLCGSSKELNELLKQSQKQYDIQSKKEQNKTDLKQQEIIKLYQLCISKKVQLGKVNMDFPDQCRKSVFLENDNTLQFPVFVSFLEFQTMDYIDKVSESQSLYSHLQEVIGEKLPYDKDNIYNVDNLEVYIELNATIPLQNIADIKNWPRQKGIKKIDYKQTILYVMQTPGYILPMVPEILVVCPSSKAFYNEQFLKNYEFV